MEFNFIYKEGFAPGQIQEISKNLRNLFSIPEGSIPLNRRLGLSWTMLSQIPPNMENDYATDLIEKVEEFEPRVSVNEVLFHYDKEGAVTVNVTLERRDKENGY